MRPGILDKWKKERPGGGEGRMEAFASDVGDSDGSSDRPAWSHAGEMMGFGEKCAGKLQSARDC